MPENDPYITCEDHGKQLGYLVCLNVWNKVERPIVTQRAGADGPGQICCSTPPEDHDVDDILMVCEECAIQHGVLLRLH